MASCTPRAADKFGANKVSRVFALVAALAFALALTMAPPFAVDAQAAITTGQAASTTSANNSQETVTVYRLYNMSSGEHLYTKDANEKNVLVNRYGWMYEGTAFFAPKTSGTKVYRVYNPRSGEHHYTTDANEVRVITSRYGWRNEGVAWYSDDSKRVAVNRLYNPRMTYGHHFTTDTNEKNVLTRSYGWRSENVGWYAVAVGVPEAYKYTEAHWVPLLNSCRNSGSTVATNGSITASQRDTLNKLASGTQCGFIALNTKTGKMVSRNPDMRQFSASSMKAIYIAALCKYHAPGIADWKSRLYTIITYSDNGLYHQLGYRYGKGYLQRLAGEANVSLDLKYATIYADNTPRELAKLWTVVTKYIRSNDVNADLFRKSFGNGGYFKEGWMESYEFCGQMYNIVGVDGDVIYAIMTKYPYRHANAMKLRSTLIAATR